MDYFRKPYMTQGMGNYQEFIEAVPQKAIEAQGEISPNIEFKKPYDGQVDTAQMMNYYSNQLHYLGGEPVPPLDDRSLASQAPVVTVEGRGDEYTKLLLHMNGVSGSRDFIDSSSVRKTMALVGDVHISSGSKLGDGCGAFNAGYIQTSANIDFNMAAGPYTIDFWMNTTKATAVGGTNMDPIYQGDVNGTPSLISHLFQIGIVAANKLSWCPNYKSYSGHTWITTGVTINDGKWHHIAAVRVGDNHMLFLDGQKQGSTLTLAGYSQTASTYPLFIGKMNTTYNQYVGLLDEVHISKGIARWTANFTPPDKEW